MDIVDAIKVQISGTGVITPKKEEVKKCNNACGCQIPTVEPPRDSDNQLVKNGPGGLW